MKAFRPVLFLTLILLVVGLACSALAGGGDTPSQPVVTDEPVQPVNDPPTTAPEPTDVPPTQAPPTQAAPAVEAPPEAQDFFVEEFDTPLSDNWSVFTVTGSAEADPDKVTVEAEDGKLIWNFDSERVYYYLFYNAYEYEDIQIDVRADNRGRNNNSISLICRYEENVGWYEFNIANNGLYDILYADLSDSTIGYETIADGGSNSIKQGKEINEYSVSCEGDKLTLTINGDEVTSITEKRFGLRSGLAGVSVSSFDVLPILIEMDWIKFSLP